MKRVCVDTRGAAAGNPQGRFRVTWFLVLVAALAATSAPGAIIVPWPEDVSLGTLILGWPENPLPPWWNGSSGGIASWDDRYLGTSPVENFSEVLGGSIGVSAEVLLDGTTLSWTNGALLETYDPEELSSFGSTYSISSCKLRIGGTLTVRGGGHLMTHSIGFGAHGRSVPIYTADYVTKRELLPTFVYEPPPHTAVIVVEDAGSTLDVHDALMFDQAILQLAVRNGATLHCAEVDVDQWQRDDAVVVEGEGSLWDVDSIFAVGSDWLEEETLTTLAVRDGATLRVGERLELRSGATLDVTDNGYAEVGAPAGPREPGVVRIGHDGMWWGDGRVAGRVVVEDGGVISRPTQIDCQAHMQGVPEMDELELRSDGRILFLVPWYATDAPAVRVFDHAELHGTIHLRPDGQFPLLDTPTAVIEFGGTSDTTGLTIDGPEWLRCTPTIAPEGVSVTFGLAGDGRAGHAVGGGDYVSGVIAYGPDEHSTVEVGPKAVQWSDGAHLVTEPQDEPGYLYVGFAGEATMTVAGRTLRNRRAEIGREAGSHGTVILDGPDTRWEIVAGPLPDEPDFWYDYNELLLGVRGRGDLVVRNGATLYLAEHGRLIIGRSSYADDGGRGSITVEGDGSRIEGGCISVSDADQGELYVVDGGQIHCHGIVFDSASDELAAMTMVVDGPDAVVKLDDGLRMSCLRGSRATVSRGGRVETTGVLVERRRSTTTYSDPIEVVIDGDGSAWHNADSFDLGEGTSLRVSDGGRLAAGQSLTCHGTISLDGGAVAVGAEGLPASLADGELRVGDGGVLVGNGTIHGHVAIDEGGQLHDQENQGLRSDYLLYDHYTLAVDSFEAAAGADLWFSPREYGAIDRLECLGDARIAGTIHVEPFWRPAEEHIDWAYEAQVLDVLTVGGTCDWTGATLAPIDDPRVHVSMHDHGLRIVVGTAVPEPGAGAMLAGALLALAWLGHRRRRAPGRGRACTHHLHRR